MTGLRSIAVLLIFLMFPALASAREGNSIVVGGGGDAIVGFFAPASEVFQDESGLRLFLNVTSPLKALFDLNGENIDIATGTVGLKELLAEAGKKLKIDPTMFHETVVGTNYTRVIINRNNPITALSKEQLKGILTGKIVNWKELGGVDREISVVWGVLTTTQNELVQKGLMDNQPMTAKKITASDYLNIRKRVMENVGSIGFVPEGLLTSLAKSLDSPKLSSQVIAITKGKPGPQEKKLLDFLVEISSVL